MVVHGHGVCHCHLASLRAVPMLHWLTLVANLREHRVSWKAPGRGDMFTNMRVLLLPPREFCSR